MIEELSHVSASYPKKKAKNGKTTQNDTGKNLTDFELYCKSLDISHTLNEIKGVKNSHLVSFQRQVNYYIGAKMKDLDHKTSYKFTLVFIDYNTEKIFESGIIIEDLIKESNIMQNPDYPEMFVEDHYNQDYRFNKYDFANGKTDKFFLYNCTSGTAKLEDIIKVLVEIKDENESPLSKLKTTEFLLLEFTGHLSLNNEQLVNLVKIMDEDIFEKQYYPNLRFMLLMHAPVTYQYKVHKPKVFVEKIHFQQNQELMYQTICLLLKSNVLPSPVFDMEFVSDMIATKLTYPSVKNIEKDWLFLKKLHAIKVRNKLSHYYTILYKSKVGDKINKEITKRNNLYKLGVLIYKLLSQLINIEDNVYVHFFEYIINSSAVTLSAISKIGEKLGTNKYDQNLKAKFSILVELYLDKIKRKIDKNNITPTSEIDEFFKKINRILKNNRVPDPKKNSVKPKDYKDIMFEAISVSPDSTAQNDIRDCIRAFEKLAKTLVSDYLYFVRHEFKELYVTEYNTYEKVVNPDICGSIMKYINHDSQMHTLDFIFNVFYRLLTEIGDQKPSFRLYDAFEAKILNAFPDYRNKPDTIKKMFYYCHQLFIHIGFMGVGNKPPFVIYAMHI